jgi:hypothetical protein
VTSSSLCSKKGKNLSSKPGGGESGECHLVRAANGEVVTVKAVPRPDNDMHPAADKAAVIFGHEKAPAQLTVEQVIRMVKAKLPDDIIITTIQKSGSKFDLTPDALIKLKTAGVSDAVIRAMTR